MAEVFPVTDRLVRMHYREAFSTTEYLPNIRKVLNVCKQLGVAAVPVRGYVDFDTVSLVHRWVELPDSGAVYDPTWAMFDPDFREVLADHNMQNDARRLQLVLGGKELSIFTRTLGDPPTDVSYRGEEFFGSQIANPDRTQYRTQ